MPEESSPLMGLAQLFDAAEAEQDWTLVLARVAGLPREHLGLLSDWLAVELIWLQVQFDRLLAQAQSARAEPLLQKWLEQLHQLDCRVQVADFDCHFPLLDKGFLHSQGANFEGNSLSQWLAWPNSKELSPHILINIGLCKNAGFNALTQHPLVYFFRYSSGYQSNALNPSPYFDCDWYRKTYLNNQTPRHPLLHYLTHYQEPHVQPSPTFFNDYVRKTQQLAVEIEPLSHYLSLRQDLDFCLTGFSPCPYFDRAFYLAHYPGIKTAAVETRLDPYCHFAIFGIPEGRIGHAWLRHESFVAHQVLGFAAKKRTAMLVLGMHRSGTSAITRVINLLGMDLAGKLMPANPANESGYWESLELAQIHDQIFAEADVSWHEILPVDEHGLQPEHWQRYKQVLMHYVVKEFADSDDFILKDPRMCMLVPLWLEALADLQVEVKVVIPFRDPVEVAESLREREGFLPEKSYLLWLWHILSAECHTRHLPRCFVDYRQLLADPEQVVQQIAQKCRISWPKDTKEASREISAFINPSLYHQRAMDCAQAEPAQTPAWVAQVYAVLNELAQDGQEAENRQKLDQIACLLQQANLMFSAVVADKEQKLRQELAGCQQALRQIRHHAQQIQALSP